jgi:hypothetical protein
MAFIKRPEPKVLLNLTEKTMQDLLSRLDIHVKRYDVMVPRFSTQIDSEADLFGIRKSGFCDEFEIKLSRADFFKDKKKVVKYRPNKVSEGEDMDWFLSPSTERAELAPWEKFKLDALRDGDMMANYFWYAIKVNIVDYSEVPAFAGVIEVDDYGLAKVIRQPEKLHSRKLSFEQRFRCSAMLNERFWKLRANAV